MAVLRRSRNRMSESREGALWKKAPLVALGVIALGGIVVYGWSRRNQRTESAPMRQKGALLVQLNAAMMSGNIGQINSILTSDPEFRKSSDWLSSPSVLRQRNTVRYLLNVGFDPDGLYHDGSPLVVCGTMADRDAALMLLHAGAHVDARSKEGFTPLMRAARDGLTPLCALLIEDGANVNATTDSARPPSRRAHVTESWQEDRTALHAAIRYDHADVVDLLLRHGADVKALTNVDETPLELAQRLKHADCAALIERASQ